MRQYIVIKNKKGKKGKYKGYCQKCQYIEGTTNKRDPLRCPICKNIINIMQETNLKN